jgi:hypothetical protein
MLLLLRSARWHLRLALGGVLLAKLVHPHPAALACPLPFACSLPAASSASTELMPDIDALEVSMRRLRGLLDSTLAYVEDVAVR